VDAVNDTWSRVALELYRLASILDDYRSHLIILREMFVASEHERQASDGRHDQ
jgi:hypothetical protein